MVAATASVSAGRGAHSAASSTRGEGIVLMLLIPFRSDISGAGWRPGSTVAERVARRPSGGHWMSDTTTLVGWQTTLVGSPVVEPGPRVALRVAAPRVSAV